MKIVPKPFWSEDSARISRTLQSASEAEQPITDCLLASTAECATDDKRERAAKRRKREEEQTEKNSQRRPDKAILRNWFGTASWTYSRCLDAVEKKEVAKNEKDLRAAFLNKDAIDNMGKKWVLETPYDIRKAALQDLLKAYDSAHARYTNDKKVFKIKHRSRRKSRQESIVIHHKHWSRVEGNAEPPPPDLNYDSRLVYQSTTGHYYLCVPMPLRVSTGRYSPDGEAIELGKNDIGHIYRLSNIP
ncbi:hypothetical protein POJ06DRAFT_255968 [Lipomyces tetrasporus]|uniref:Uncharacterized protein n=1 Tax=Lipomyces tetrasporus TaxID=54092 RepID=A0AAD7VRW2_9ASCO|nr:uncharacterized protein POJ06DRAFT_255968 [Lipomyces tetrasporus]KAJ8099099.1 hypothetical protein POJ06DRAFT_255968 [Lipomyces tetrasporus]